MRDYLTYAAAAVFAAIFVADLFVFHRLPTDTDLAAIYVAAGAVGIPTAFRAGVASVTKP